MPSLVPVSSSAKGDFEMWNSSSEVEECMAWDCNEDKADDSRPAEHKIQDKLHSIINALNVAASDHNAIAGGPPCSQPASCASRTHSSSSFGNGLEYMPATFFEEIPPYSDPLGYALVLYAGERATANSQPTSPICADPEAGINNNARRFRQQ